jgi:ureidoglycolate hydrolase
MTLTPAPASEAAFGRFGKVVLSPRSAPTSEANDYRFWSDLAHYEIRGETEIGLCQVFRQPANVITGMERHLRTPEILIPIDAPFVLPLLREGSPSSDAGVFRVEPGQAVVIDPAVWHGACLPVGAEASWYFVIFRRGTPGTDVEKKPIEPFTIEGV